MKKDIQQTTSTEVETATTADVEQIIDGIRMAAFHECLHFKGVKEGKAPLLKEFREISSRHCSKETIERYLETENSTGSKAITMFQ